MRGDSASNTAASILSDDLSFLDATSLIDEGTDFHDASVHPIVNRCHFLERWF